MEDGGEERRETEIGRAQNTNNQSTRYEREEKRNQRVEVGGDYVSLRVKRSRHFLMRAKANSIT